MEEDLLFFLYKFSTVDVCNLLASCRKLTYPVRVMKDVNRGERKIEANHLKNGGFLSK